MSEKVSLPTHTLSYISIRIELGDECTVYNIVFMHKYYSDVLYSVSVYRSYGSHITTTNTTLSNVICNSNVASARFIRDCSYDFVEGYSSGGCSIQNPVYLGCYGKWGGKRCEPHTE